MVLLGAATPATPVPPNPAFTQLAGVWNCTRGGVIQEGWTARLVVAPQPDGSFEFTQTGTSNLSEKAEAHFYLSYDPSNGTWTQTDPDFPFPLAGKQNGNEVLMAAPLPQHRRFQLELSPSGQVFAYLVFDDPVREIKSVDFHAYQSHFVECNRQGG